MNSTFMSKEYREKVPFSYDSIRNICERYPEIIAAYLFGSRATDQDRPESDWDVALLLKPDSETEFDYLGFKVALEKALQRDVDLVILNNAGAPIKHQVRRDGKVIFDRDPQKRTDWEIRSRKMYQDFIHLHAIYMRRMKNVLRSSPHGG